MATKKTKSKLSDRELFDARRKANALEQKAKALVADAGDLKVVVVDEMRARGVKAVEMDGDRITFVEPEVVTYDSDGLWEGLTVAQRREAFDEEVNLNLLSAATRKKLIESLPKAERRNCTTRTLNTDRLSQAVQNGAIDKGIVSEHSTVGHKNAYTLLSRPGGK